MLRIPIREALRMKLHAQKERQPASRTGFQFEAFDNTIVRNRDRPQSRGDSVHSLMVRAIDAQLLRAGYLGE